MKPVIQSNLHAGGDTCALQAGAEKLNADKANEVQRLLAVMHMHLHLPESKLANMLLNDPGPEGQTRFEMIIAAAGLQYLAVEI